MLSQSDKRILWATADKLRVNMDAAEYKHLVLGLIFVKYVSDSFESRRQQLILDFKNPDSEWFLEEIDERTTELEERDYYLSESVFWVPPDARFDLLQQAARQPDLGVTIDKSLEAIERDNPSLKGLLDKRFARTQLPPDKLGELVDLVAKMGFGAGDKARDLLGEVYEYFLGQFALAEGKKGGSFYTPDSVVKVLVETLAPHQGRVYDPCCGSGGMFVQSEKFVKSHQGKLADVSIFGQESNYTTWKLAAMNMAIHGFDANLGREAGDSFLSDQHPDLRADTVLANPPFNVSDWWHPKLDGDIRWLYGTPPMGNANFAWLQHIVFHLSERGRAGVVLANGSMSSNQGGEGEIRRRLVESDRVELMVALPPQLFFNTQIPACLWFLTKDKAPGLNGQHDRRNQTLFIDARGLGTLETRVFRVFSASDIAQIAQTYHKWRGTSDASGDYADTPGFCQSADKSKIAEHGFILTPGRYVEAVAVEQSEAEFAEQMTTLTQTLARQFEQSAKLEQKIKTNLAALGLEV